MNHQEKGKIGLWGSTSLVAGNMIGSGIFLLPASMALYGGISSLGWLVSGGGALLLAFVFARLSRRYSEQGGMYAFTRRAYGDFAGFLVGWGYWISIWCSNAAIAVAMISYLSFFIPGLSGSPAVQAICAIATVWMLIWVNSQGVKSGVRFQVVSTAVKIIPLLLFATFGLFFIEPGNFKPLNLSTVSDFEAITATATLTFFAFLGVECATIPAQAVTNPSVTIPKATLLGTVATMVLYLLSSTAVFGIMGSGQLSNSEAPYADAAVTLVGGFGAYLVSFGAVVSTIGALNGWILLQGQVPLAIAKDRLFPSRFGNTNKRGAPVFGLVFGGVMISFLIVASYTKGMVAMFTFALLLSTLTVLVPYLFCSFAEVVLIAKAKPGFAWKDVRKPVLLGIPSFTFALFAVYGAGNETVFYGFLLLMAGIPFYVWTKLRGHAVRS